MRAIVMPPCPIHGTATVCPRCSGAKGGKIGGLSTSRKKRKAVRANLALTPMHQTAARRRKQTG